MKTDLIRRNRLFTFVTLILVVAAGVISSYFSSNDAATSYLTFYNEGYLTVMDNAGNCQTLNYCDITAATYLAAPNYGECDGGSQTETLRLGQWHSPELGSYYNCTLTELDCCVFLEATTGNYAISYQDADTTRQLAQALLSARDRLITSASE